jgi:hypothetical protein
VLKDEFFNAAAGHAGGIHTPNRTIHSLKHTLQALLSAYFNKFLKEHGIFDYSAADFEQDRETLRGIRMTEARP